MIKKLLLFLFLILISCSIYVCFLRKDLILPSEYIINKYKEADSKFINWRGAKLHYTDTGSGFPIIMIHGFGGSFKDFKDLDSLMNHEYRIIRVDVPGFGLSEFPGEATAATNFTQVYNEYFDFLIDTLHLDSFYLMGNSLGGMMSWSLALRYPDKIKKLVLFNSAGYDMDEVEKTANVKRFQNPFIKVALKRGVPYFMTERGVNRVFYNKNGVNEAKIQRMNDFWNKEGALNQIISMANSKNYLDEKDIKNITVPTLIIWGTKDVIVQPKYAERFHQDIKGSELIVYDACGHVPMIEYPEKVYKDVSTFLKK